MSVFEKTIAVPANELDHRLAVLPGAFRLRDEGRVWVGAFPVERSSSIDPSLDSLDWQELLSGVPQWVGVLPYEAFRGRETGGRNDSQDQRSECHISSIIWQRYDAVGEVKSDMLHLRGCSSKAVERLEKHLVRAATPSRATLRWAKPPEDAELHKTRVRTALEKIGAGELYQVNLARRFSFEVEGHALQLLASLGPMAHAPFAAAMDLGDVQVVSTSPELFLEFAPDGWATTKPIKGTRPRSSDPNEDERLAKELNASEKERAELAMVIDIERNDLGRLAVPGSVKMTESPRIVSHPTVHHREATVRAQLLPNTTREQLLMATMPSGSVTGAPKVAAMNLIAELESERRGLYTGALGYIAHDGLMRLSMAIRVLTLRNGEAHYYTGGGIVADSDPEQELQETRWKAEQLRALVDV